MVAVRLRIIAGGEVWCAVEREKNRYFETKSRIPVKRERSLCPRHTFMGVFDHRASEV